MNLKHFTVGLAASFAVLAASPVLAAGLPLALRVPQKQPPDTSSRSGNRITRQYPACNAPPVSIANQWMSGHLACNNEQSAELVNRDSVRFDCQPGTGQLAKDWLRQCTNPKGTYKVYVSPACQPKANELPELWVGRCATVYTQAVKDKILKEAQSGMDGLGKLGNSFSLPSSSPAP